MRIGLRTLFPTSPPENDRWAIEVVSKRTMLSDRVRDWVWPFGFLAAVFLAFSALRAWARVSSGRTSWTVVLAGVLAGALLCAALFTRWAHQRRARIRALELDSRRCIASGKALEPAVEFLNASAYRDKRFGGSATPLEIALFLGATGVVEVWVDAPKQGMFEIGLPPGSTGVILCTTRGEVAGISFSDESGRKARLTKSRGNLIEPGSSIAEFEARLARQPKVQ